jgi:lysophospholipase L1-like esterase
MPLRIGNQELPFRLGNSTPNLHLGNSLVAFSKWQNLLRWSEDYTNAAWEKGEDTLVTAGATLGPTGTPAQRVVLQSEGTTFLHQTVSLVAGNDYTLSAWVKAGPEHEVVSFFCQPTSGGSVKSKELTPTGEWSLFTWTFTQTVTQDVNVGIDNSSDDEEGSDVYLFGFCLSESPFFFGYRRTESAAFPDYPPNGYFLAYYPRTIPLSIGSRTKHIAFGDSITVGLQATSYTVGGYAYRFASENKLTITNLAQSGLGVWACANQIRQATIDRPNTLISMMAGLNDLRRATDRPRLRRKIEACATSVAIHALCGTKISANSGSVTRTGSMSAYAAQQYAGVFSTSGTAGLGALSASGAATWEFAFTGENVAVQFIGGCGGIDGTETFGSVDVKIDGAVVETIDLDTWFDGSPDLRGPVGRIYTGLGAGTHSIVVETKTSSIVPLDFFAVPDPPSSAAALIFNEIPYMSADGYAEDPDNGSADASPECSAVFRLIASRLRDAGYHAGFVAHNMTFYKISTGLSGDQIHPNDVGHADIADAMQAALIKDPNSQPSPAWWLDASDESTVSTTGTDVDEWADKSDTGLDLIQAEPSNKPSYANTHNGLKVITFDGSNDSLSAATALNLGTRSYTVFCVAVKTSAGFHVLIDGSLNPYISSDNDGEEKFLHYDGSTSLKTEDGAYTLQEWFVLECVISRNERAIFVNGTQQASGPGTFRSAGLRTVGSATAGSFNWAGRVGEILVYDRQLTPSERTGIRIALGEKWGIAVMS